MARIPQPPINDVVQIEAMKSRFPSFHCFRKSGNIIFKGDLLIKRELPIYNVSIVYRRAKNPKVFINSPQLKFNAPHRYKEGNICLYHPSNFRWNGRQLIAKQIMDWTIAWIYFYEVWLETGVWYGPEVPHGEEKHDN